MLIGDPLGEATVNGVSVDAPTALKYAELEPLVLEAKDGLAITNGAQLSTAIATLKYLGRRNDCARWRTRCRDEYGSTAGYF